jgi:hypothetical protein
MDKVRPCKQRFEKQPMWTQRSEETNSKPDRRIGLPAQDEQNAPFPGSKALHLMIRQAKRWQLSLPLLLFFEAHRPLRFLVGQTLVVAAPVAGLLGFDDLEVWAAVLDDDDALLHLRQALEATTRQDGTAS